MEQTRGDNVNSTTINENSWQYFFTRENLIYAYSTITIVLIVVAFITSYSFYSFCMKASNNLHNNMFSKIVYASMFFFNTNASGRILNRFSKDMGAVDETLPVVLGDAIQVSKIV